MHSTAQDRRNPVSRTFAGRTEATRSSAAYCIVRSTRIEAVFRMPEKYVTWSTLRRQIANSMRRHHDVRAKSIVSIGAFAGSIGGDEDGGRRLTTCRRAFQEDAAGLEKYALHAWEDRTAGFVLVRKPHGGKVKT